MAKGNDNGSDKWGGQEKPSRKEAFMAGFAAGEVVDSAEEAWENYKIDPAGYDPEADEADAAPDAAPDAS